MKAEILYGFHPVYEALRASRRTFFEIYFQKHTRAPRMKRIKSAAARKGLPLKEVEASNLQTIAGSVSHQGIAAKVTPFPLSDVDDILKLAVSDNRSAFIILLDNIVDPHNLGAIVRTAVCVGVDGVIIPKDRAAYPTPAVSKISTGALEHVRLAQVNNLVRMVNFLKDQGVWILGLDPNADQSIFTADLTGSIGIIVGGEEKGIRPLVKKNCDSRISIPQSGPISSLNASVAGAIVMYESYRQRNVSKSP